MSAVAPETRAVIDNEHLKLLAIFHYIVGALHALWASIFIIHFFMGVALLLNPEGFFGKAEKNPPAFFGAIIMIFTGSIVLAGWTIGGLTIYSGLCIKRRARRTFSIVMAGINCALFPFGTVLGVMTIIVLLRDSVRSIYLETSHTAS
jgi:hypothetical protein